MAQQATVEFYYDISCPFAYIASTRIEALAVRTNAKLLWRPVLLGAIYRAIEAPQGAAGSASDVYNPTKKAITSQAFRRTLHRFNIPYNEPPKHPIKTTAPLRLLYYIDEESRPKLTHALFRAYWVDGKDVSNRSVLLEVARGTLDQETIKAVENGSFEGDEQRRELEKFTDLAVQRGTPGVPGFWIPQAQWTDKSGQKQTGRLYWGQDRMHFVEAALECLNAGYNISNQSSLSRRLLSLLPHCVQNLSIPDGEEAKLQFWYDFSSPWAFLGWTQLARLQRQFGQQLHVEMKPFLLGILFREIGAPNEPGSAVSKQRQAYNGQDHPDWVQWWNAVNDQEGKPNKNIDFQWASIFPIRTPTVLRAVIAEPELVGPLYRGCWEQNLDMASEDVVKRVIDEAGYSGAEILKRANEQDCKSKLRNLTKEAKDNGLCGVPSYRVFHRKKGEDENAWKLTGDIVWGQDELPVVEDMIAGWNGNGVAEVGQEKSEKVSSKL